MSDEPKNRFSDRVETYQKYRPSYPASLLETLIQKAGLTSRSQLVDLGSGTGIFTKLLLEQGLQVTAVEPNAPMREAAETTLRSFPSYRSIDAPAESTGLPDASFDLAVAAQAFHWFEREPCKIEITRILRPGGRVALVWNERLTYGSVFLSEYDALLRDLATDYNRVNHTNISAELISEFFSPNPVTTYSFENAQVFDWRGLRGRCESSSYVPASGHPQHQAFFRELKSLFDRHQAGGTVRFEYQTKLYLGAFR
ncbi:class I SAM-dependent methyltransferase [Pelagicoccus sp. SDUM812002]|uniref:class I SAM-dependent methyltransferase n=1 Tax=Pelagicoccus sp. SDUM812002 TaxID=3041266 RepID=UPI00280EB550|nr:class I SAM-dependent methyltransferase [Pelagicoccus sp. SDUM812002]MDQ8188252.1 class I SAM-dependent methyltransferase [Pelagicoccus sp. SDUM812002]